MAVLTRLTEGAAGGAVLVLVAACLCVAACAPLSTPSGNSPDTYGTLVPETPVVVTPVAGYPYPGPGEAGAATARTPKPTRTASPTPPYAAALPDGAQFDFGDVSSWYPHDDDLGDWVFSLRYSLDGTPGVAILYDKEPNNPEDLPDLLWDLAEYDGIDFPIERIQWKGAMLVIGEDDTAFLDLHVGAAGSSVLGDYRLGIVPDDDTIVRPSLMETDLSGDSVPDPLVIIRAEDHEPGHLILYERSDGPATREIGRFGLQAQVLDLDRDGRAEVLVPEAEGRWQAFVHEGSQLTPIDPVVERTGPDALPVRAEDLPPLPADLYFARDGGIYKWPAQGGVLKEIRPGSADGEWALVPPMWDNVKDPYGVRPYAVSADGRTVAYVEQRPADGDVAEQRFVLLDTETGDKRTVPVRGAVSQAYASPAWDVTPDGRWLVFLDFGAADLTQPADEDNADVPPWRVVSSTGGPFSASLTLVDLASADLLQSQLAYCGVGESPETHYHVNGCARMSQSLSLDGQHVAYADGTGIWVVAIPDGQPKLVLRHHYGEWETDIRHYIPEQWSPDGERMLASVGGYEGSATVLLDIATGQVQALSDTSEYVGPMSDLTWLPDGSGIVHARTLSENPLTIIDAVDATKVTRLPWHISHVTEGGYSPVSPHVSADGTIRFAMRHADPSLYRASGVFRLAEDGEDWDQQVHLPGVHQGFVDEDTYSPGRVYWTENASGFLVVDGDPSYARSTGTAIVGIDDGASLWDAADALRDAWWFTWGR